MKLLTERNLSSAKVDRLPYMFIPFSHLRGKRLTVDCPCLKPKLLQLSRFVVLFDTSVKSNTTDERINVTIFLCTAVIQQILFFLLQKQFKCRQDTVCFLYRHIILLSHHAVTQSRP
jgi:hypothetical protein